MTKVEKLNAIKEFVKDYPEYVEFLEKEVDRLDGRAKRVAEKRAEKNDAKCENYEGAILDALAGAGRAITLAELVAGIGLEDATPGRVAYYAGKLVKAGKVAKDKAKVEGRKVTIYEVA